MELSPYELIKYPTGQYVLLRQELQDPSNPSLGMSSIKDLVGFFASREEALRAYDRVASRGPTDERSWSNATDDPAEPPALSGPV